MATSSQSFKFIERKVLLELCMFCASLVWKIRKSMMVLCIRRELWNLKMTFSYTQEMNLIFFFRFDYKMNVEWHRHHHRIDCFAFIWFGLFFLSVIITFSSYWIIYFGNSKFLVDAYTLSHFLNFRYLEQIIDWLCSSYHYVSVDSQ